MSVSDRLTTIDSVAPGMLAFAGWAALAVAMGIGRFAFTPVLPMMLDEGLVSISEGAWLASANYLGYLLGALSAMALRMSPAVAIRGALSVIIVTTLAMSMVMPFAIWALLRLLAGMASAWVLISVSAWSMDWVARHQRPFLSSVVFAGVGSGIAIAGLVCIGLVALDATAAQAWIALGLFSLALSLLVWKRFATPSTLRGGSHAGEWRWNEEALRLVLSYGLFGFGYIIPATFLPVMARQALGDGPAFAWAWPVFGLAAAISVLPVALLVQRMGRRRLWGVAQLVLALGVAMPLFGDHPVLILMAAAAVGGMFVLITLVALQEARQVAGRNPTGLLAAMTAAFATGQMLGPLTIGKGTFTIPLAYASVALTVGVLLLVPRKPQPSSIQE